MMKRAQGDPVSNAVLYEGYLLYPYRDSAIKNQFRWTFGCLFPRQWCQEHDPSERDCMHAEVLVESTSRTQIDCCVRFLLLPPPDANGRYGPPEQREVMVSNVQLGDASVTKFSVSVGSNRKDDGPEAGSPEIVGQLRIDSLTVRPSLHRLVIEVRNCTPFGDAGPTTRNEASVWALLSTQILVSCREGGFVSLMDPPEAFRLAAGECRNDGCFPVMSGAKGTRYAMLIAPIILYDYPQLAPESQGELFDGTEIDEMLTMRVRTLTDDEKAEVANADPRALQLLQRSDSMHADELQCMHGLMRETSTQETTRWEEVPQRITVDGFSLGKGDQVVLRPNGKSDIFDLALAGTIATIETIERDIEGQLFFTVTSDLDPGKDFGRLGLPGHRFFFRPDEVEPLVYGTTEEKSN